MRRPKFKAVKFNTVQIMDVVFASLIVQQAPKLIQSFIPMDETVSTVAGVGAGYLAGAMFNRPYLSNAAIALGAVQFVAPLVDDLLGGGGPTSVLPAGPTGKAIVYNPGVNSGIPAYKNAKVADYINLNDYISLSASQVNETYRNSY